jgi:peptide/nickel transport system permease protein
MLNYLVRRIFQMGIVVFLSSLAIYMLLNIAPGGPLSGIRLNADRRSRVSDVDIARIEAYLGLDKPLILRYIVWLVGDDWLGANWVYAGVKPFTQQQVGRDGMPIFQEDSETGELAPVYQSFRFWTDPGVALIQPGYKLFVWGEEIESGVWDVTKLQVKPRQGAQLPEDAALSVDSVSVNAANIEAEDLNGRDYTLRTNADTLFLFPEGEARPRPQEGSWLDISWLTGAQGLFSQYAGFHGDTRGVLRMDFGFSWRLSPGQPVIEIIRSRLGNTLALMSTAIIFSLLVAVPIGIYSAVHQYSRMDYAVTTFAFFGSAMPVFWFGLMMILVFSLFFKQWGLPFMPSGGTQLVRAAQPGSMLALLGATPGSLVDRLVHIVMPASVLSLLYMAGWSRFMRTSMLEVLRMDYVRTARAKGLRERVVIARHAARNALIPLITVIAFQLPGVFGGAILTETIFSYPGMGRLYFDALGGNDWPIVMMILFISAVLVVVATLLRDILYTLVDPRIKYA